MHDVYDALTAALSSFMDRRPRFCRRVTGRLVGAHPRALGGAGGRARRRVVVLSARKYILCIHTRPTVAWDPPPGAYRARAGSRTILVLSDNTSKGKGLNNSIDDDQDRSLADYIELALLHRAYSCSSMSALALLRLTGVTTRVTTNRDTRIQLY